jgi:N-acetylmuramoyl-L-alanine amidase
VVKTRAILQGLLIFPAFLALSSGALASEDGYPGRAERLRELRAAPVWGLEPGAALLPVGPSAPALPPDEAFARTVSVLRHLQVPAELDSQPELEGLALRQNLAGVQALLPVLDPTGTFRRFLRSPIEGALEAYQDIDSREVSDFGVRLASGDPAAPVDAGSFHERLLRARSNPASSPLAGLRIAIDPGHMGGAFWDRETGKEVHDSQGHILSEGVLNLQTALLLERSFEALGAQVALTHRELGPVSRLDYEHLDFARLGRDYLRDNTLEGWFQGLLSAGAAGSEALFAAFDSSAAIRKLFAASDFNRQEYFILGEDLAARAQAINDFDADIALVIHYDTNTPASDPWGVSPTRREATKVYVPGSYEPTELSSRASRASLARHLLDAITWRASLELGRDVVSELHSRLGLDYDGGGGGYSHAVEPGIFARNLGVVRRVSGRALTYVECLYYSDPVEFAALLDARHPMQIGGQNHPYSDRLAQVAGAIQSGVLKFVAHYGE